MSDETWNVCLTTAEQIQRMQNLGHPKKKPITVTCDASEVHMVYTEDDALTLGKACGQALKSYVDAGGELDNWSITAEPYQTDTDSGVRVTVYGYDRDAR